MLSVSPSPLYFVRIFFSQLLFVNLNPVCWKNEGSSRPGSSGANCLKFFLLAKVFCNALQNSSRIALLALDVLCGLDTVGSFNEVLVCWRICLGHWLHGDFSSQVPALLIATPTPRSGLWLCPIVGEAVGSLGRWLLGKQVLELLCKLHGLLPTIYDSFAQEGWWIARYTGTLKINCPAFLPLVLFNWCSCRLLHH